VNPSGWVRAVTPARPHARFLRPHFTVPTHAFTVPAAAFTVPAAAFHGPRGGIHDSRGGHDPCGLYGRAKSNRASGG